MQDASWRYTYIEIQHVTYHDQKNTTMTIRLKGVPFCASLLKLTACNRANPFNKESVIPRDFLLDDQALVSWFFKRDFLKIVAFQQNIHTAFIILQTQNSPQIVKCTSLNTYLTFALFDPDIGNSRKPDIGPGKWFQGKLLGNHVNGMHHKILWAQSTKNWQTLI